MDAIDIDESLSYKPQHPLPEELQKMNKDDTVCQYCGVSYLIHNEIKKLQNKLESYQKEIERLMHYDDLEAELKLQIKNMEKESDTIFEKWKLESEKLIQSDQIIVEKNKYIVCLEDELYHLRNRSVEEKQAWESKFLEVKKTCIRVLDNLNSIRDKHGSVQEQFHIYRKECKEFIESKQNKLIVEINKLVKNDENLEEQIEYLLQQKVNAEANHKKSLQTLQEQHESQVKQLISTKDQHIQSHVLEKQKYQEQMRRLKESKKNCVSESEEKVVKFEKIIEDLTLSLKIEKLDRDNDKQAFQNSLNCCKEEVHHLENERESLIASHKTSMHELNDDFVHEKQEYKEKLEKQNLELHNQRNEVKKQEEDLKERHKNDIKNMKDMLTKDLRQEKGMFERKEAKIKGAIEEMQRKCENAVGSLLQRIEDTQKQHEKEVSKLKKDISQLMHELSESKRQLTDAKYQLNDSKRQLNETKYTQRNNQEYTKDDYNNSVKKVHALRATVEELQTEVKLKEEKTHKQENDIRSLRECVRRECEERYELTEALSNARTELLSLQRFPDNNKNNHHEFIKLDILQPTPPQCGRKSLPPSSQSISSSSEESWSRHLTKNNQRKNIHRSNLKTSFDRDVRTEGRSPERDTTSIRNKLRISINNNR